MKKLLIILTVLTAFAFAKDKLTIEMPLNDWAVYMRNIDRIKAMGGRTVPSDILFSTIDTLNMYQGEFYKQINKQLTDTTKKK